MARLEKTSRDMLFACISPSEANYSWSCSLCDIHGLKAQTFWLHCLGQQHTQASQSALEEQLAAELEAVAAEHSAQSKLEVKKEAINQKEKSIGAMREYVETESELVESLALELPVQQVNAKVSAFSTPSITPEPLCMVETATRGDVKAEPLLLKHSGDCELVKGEEVIVMKAMSETLSVAEQVAQEDVETLSQLVKPAGGEEPEALIVVVPGSMDNLEKPTLAEPFVKVSVEQVFVNDTVFITDVIMHKTKPDLVKLPKEDAMEEITLESIAPCSFTVNNISTKADHFERSAFATRNDDNEYWSCNLCGIYTLQAHSVKSHCLGKKHMKAFEIAHQPQIRLSPKQSTPSTEMKLKVKFAFDKSIQEAACVDKRFTFVSLVEAGSAWYCTLCKIKTLQVKDVKPHCLGKRHLTAYLAQVERPFRDNSEVRMEHDGLPLNEASE